MFIIVKHVDILYKPVGNGITSPLYGSIDNEMYIIKTINGPEGNIVLVNEFVCYHIAKLLNLPIPDIELALIDETTNINAEVWDTEDFSEKCFGLAFCSKYVKNASPLEISLFSITEDLRILISNLVLFDHFICNKDRNKGNLLTTNKSICVIDHSHAFDIGSLWNSVELRRRMTEENCFSSDIMDKNFYYYEDFKDLGLLDMIYLNQAKDNLKEKITEKNLREIIDKIPKEWESDIEKLNSLFDYLKFRLENIDTFVSVILSHLY